MTRAIFITGTWEAHCIRVLPVYSCANNITEYRKNCGTMSDEAIAKAFREAGIGKEIKCPQAFAIAEKCRVPVRAVGDYCNANKIKIRGCQLGCFP